MTKTAEKQRLEVDTPFGKLVATQSDSPYYPGIQIYLEDNSESNREPRLLALFESDSESSGYNELRGVIWENSGQTDPIFSHTYIASAIV
jgi:hypothetical protein